MPEADLSRALGRIEGKLESLITATEQNERSACAHRERLYSNVKELGDRMQAAEQKGLSTDETLEKMKPFAEKVDTWEKRGAGALAVAGVVGGFIVTALTALWSSVKHLIHFKFGG